MTEEHSRTFHLYGGKQINNLKGLAEELRHMEDSAFFHHVNDLRNDFANWMKHSLKEEELSEKVKNSMSKIEIELEVLRHLVKEVKTEHDQVKKNIVAKKKTTEKVITISENKPKKVVSKRPATKKKIVKKE